ncbi:MAG: peptidase domain protein [Francisellaceae bacterium]|nr:peptidase domain protein [Francisellaceae bacterium]
MQEKIIYQIEAPNPHNHLFEVKCLINVIASEPFIISLPAWIPGSYMIRDFAKNIVSIKASSLAKELQIEKIDKSSWKIENSSSPIEICYSVYAFELSVRGAYLDAYQGYFNGSRVFIKIHGFEEYEIELHILKPTHNEAHNWQLATSMTAHQAKFQFGIFSALNYEELIDHPVQMGNFEVISFDSENIRHDLVITGRHWGNTNRLKKDLAAICEYHLSLFGRPHPIKYYVFLLSVLAEGYGGLEHRASSSLQIKRDCLPQNQEDTPSIAYQNLLSLLSHEYFHLWHIKRIKPQAFMQLNLDQEVYTQLLWIFEGFTAYYDEISLVRAKCITPKAYLNLLTDKINRLHSIPGALVQTVTESSMDAWTKFYKADENAPNSCVSYYLKGSLIALCIDLSLRYKSKNLYSLDCILRHLWIHYAQKGIGIKEDELNAIIKKVTNISLEKELNSWCCSTDLLPFDTIFEYAGLEWVPLQDPSKKTSYLKLNDLGIYINNSEKELKVSHVLSGSIAERAGLAPFDVIVAINHLKTDKNQVDALLESFGDLSSLSFHFFRRDELKTIDLIVDTKNFTSKILKLKDVLDKNQQLIFNNWLDLK